MQILSKKIVNIIFFALLCNISNLLKHRKMDESVKRVRKELNKFLGSNRINTKMLYHKDFISEFEFPVSGRTVYRITAEKKRPTLRTQSKILERFGIKHEVKLNRIEIIEDANTNDIQPE